MGFEWQPSTNCRIFSRTPPWRHLEGHRHWALGCETSIPETQNPKNWDILWYLMISWSEDISRSWTSSEDISSSAQPILQVWIPCRPCTRESSILTFQIPGIGASVACPNWKPPSGNAKKVIASLQKKLGDVKYVNIDLPTFTYILPPN